MKKILGILAIAVLAVCFAGCAKNTPEAVVEDYVKAMKDFNIEKAMTYTTLSEEEQKKAVSLAEAFLTDELKEEMAIESYEIGKAEIAEDGNSAKVKYTMTLKKGDKQEEEAELVKVDGKWKIKEDLNK